MENIHGVDVSWLHNTNSRGMLSVLSFMVAWWWLGGGCWVELLRRIRRAGAEVTVGTAAAEDASNTTANTGSAEWRSQVRQDFC